MPKRKFALLKRREEFQSHFTVLDIGTEFVKALIVKRENDKGIVLGVGKVARRRPTCRPALSPTSRRSSTTATAP